MTKTYIERHYNYNFKMNQDLIGLIKLSENADEYILKIFAHLLSAEKIWLTRPNVLSLVGQI